MPNLDPPEKLEDVLKAMRTYADGGDKSKPIDAHRLIVGGFAVRVERAIQRRSEAGEAPLVIEELAEVAKQFTIKSCDRWKGPARHTELSCEQIQGLRLRDYCWSCLIPKLLTAASGATRPPVPTSL